MSRLKWRRKHGYWYLKRRGERRKLAEVFRVPKGWVVCLPGPHSWLSGTFSGPYGNFDTARLSAEIRSGGKHAGD